MHRVLVGKPEGKRPLGKPRRRWEVNINPLKPELNPTCYFLTLLGAHHFLHVSRIRVKLLTLRLLMSYIYIYIYIYDISRLRVKMDLQEVGGVRGDWMELAQHRDRWRALAGTVRDFRVP